MAKYVEEDYYNLEEADRIAVKSAFDEPLIIAAW